VTDLLRIEAAHGAIAVGAGGIGARKRRGNPRREQTWTWSYNINLIGIAQGNSVLPFLYVVYLAFG
jgi:hypothetical protein